MTNIRQYQKCKKNVSFKSARYRFETLKEKLINKLKIYQSINFSYRWHSIFMDNVDILDFLKIIFFCKFFCNNNLSLNTFLIMDNLLHICQDWLRYVLLIKNIIIASIAQ